MDAEAAAAAAAAVESDRSRSPRSKRAPRNRRLQEIDSMTSLADTIESTASSSQDPTADDSIDGSTTTMTPDTDDVAMARLVAAMDTAAVNTMQRLLEMKWRRGTQVWK